MVWSTENSDTIILIFGTALLVMMVVAFISFYLFYQRRLLREQNRAQALELDLQRKVMAAIIDTQEIERQRMAEDMHDELGALILALKLSNHQLLNSKEEMQRNERIERNEELIESIAHRVREVSHNLLPPALKRGHFENAIENLCSMMNDNTKLDFHFEYDAGDAELSKKDQISLYRVVNEWLTNIVKHSSSKKVEVDFHKNGNHYILDIKDDGKQFDFNTAIQEHKGLGLMSIDGRLRQMNARYSFKKNGKKGNHLEIRYPIGQ